MDQFRERLDGISEASQEELQSLLDDIAGEFETVSSQEISRESVDAMDELAEASQRIKQEMSNREAELSELSARADAAKAAMGGDSEESGDNGETAESSEKVEESETATEENPFVEEEEEEEELPLEEEEDEEKKKALGEASTSSEPVNTSGTKEDPEKLAGELNKENAKAEAEKDTTNSDKSVKETETPESPEKLLTDVEKEHQKATSVDSPVEAEATTIPEDEQEKILEEENPSVEHKFEASVEENDDTNPAEASKSQDNSENTNLEETLTASANDINVPEEHRGAPKAVAPVRTIVAGSDLPGITAGQQLPDMRAVAQGILARQKGMGRTSGGDGEMHTVATFSTEFPESRTLSPTDQITNQQKVESVVASMSEEHDALVAAGGLMAPVDTSYDLYGLGKASRPVRDSLPVFNADRGGLRFLTPPVLTDLEGAVSLWTLQDDIDAATEGAPDPVKPCLRVNAGEEVTVYIDAVTLCLTFGNIGARTFPELVERHTELGMIQHARFAETRLMTRIGNLSTKVTAPAQLGLARDVFVQVETAAAAYRGRYRMEENDKLHAIFPQWFKNALRADLTKQAPGDGRETTFELAEAKINQWFNIRNIKVTWSIDGETGQNFGPQTAPVAPATSAVLDGFPSTLVWYLFSEGTFLFLDGGTLDLGLVRDSTLNGTNDYQIFLETFEGVAKVGIESLRIASAVKIVGSASALTNINV